MNNRKIHLFLSIFILSLFLNIHCSKENTVNSPQETEADELKIASPENLAEVSGIVKIKASISNNLTIDKTQFYINEMLEFTDTQPPYEYNWNTQGCTNNIYHVLQIKGYHQNNLIATSEIVTVKVMNTGAPSDSIPPTVKITPPLMTLNYRVW